MKTIYTLGQDFNKRHKWLLAAARYCGVALCGGCAAAVTKSNADYVPKDIDFAATKSGALKLIGLVNEFMLERSVHFRIYANSKNDFVPSRADAHFRITNPFWLPVCLFVLPDEAFRAYRIKGGHLLQLYTDIKEAADELTEIDQKPRLANEPDDSKVEQAERINENDGSDFLERPTDRDYSPFERLSDDTPQGIGSTSKQ